ncbi:MAG TPA: zinc ribbon domain-containing protein, partial [Pyrinomonadaceae bacterium]|nr:zinc ribbon domain-containing protein [Pyrinomonadaceae bacterium]
MLYQRRNFAAVTSVLASTMYCPTCGSEERQISQYCRACGTDLRLVRRGLERPDTITASAVSARERISQVMAEKIREMDTAQ